MPQIDLAALPGFLLLLAITAPCLLTAFWARRKGWTLLYWTLLLVMLPFIVLVAFALGLD